MNILNRQLSYGLDFGTSNSVLSVVVNGQVKVLPINIAKSCNQEIFESVIYFQNQKIKYATEAIDSYLKDLNRNDTNNLNNGRIMRSFKSALGSDTNFVTNIAGQKLSLEDILTIFFKEIKNRGDSLVGESVSKITIGHPVKFVNDGTNGATPLRRLYKAAKSAGFAKINFALEPVGAIYGCQLENVKKIFAIDFGGGTLDMTIVNLESNKVEISQGITIGGDLIDHDMYDFYIAKYLGKNLRFGNNQIKYPAFLVSEMIDWFDVAKYNDISFFDYLDSIRYKANEPETIEFIRFFLRKNLTFSLRKKIVEAKEELSEKNNANCYFKTEIKTIKEIFDRSTLDKILEPYLLELKSEIYKVLTAVAVSPQDIDKVIITGGSGQIPKFRVLIKEIFGEEKLLFYNPFVTVSKGLALISQKDNFN